MPRVEVTRELSLFGNRIIFNTIYSDEEIEDLISSENFIREEARRRGSLCVVKICSTKEQAIKMARRFYQRFSSYECIHWNGETISFYCGEAGSGAKQLFSDVSSLF